MHLRVHEKKKKQFKNKIISEEEKNDTFNLRAIPANYYKSSFAIKRSSGMPNVDRSARAKLVGDISIYLRCCFLF